MAVFVTSKIPEIDFTENLSDKKVLKFLHCVYFSTINDSKQMELTEMDLFSAHFLSIDQILGPQGLLPSNQRNFSCLQTDSNFCCYFVEGTWDHCPLDFGDPRARIWAHSNEMVTSLKIK